MLNRRAFLKRTTAAIPLGAAFQFLEPASAPASERKSGAMSGPEPKLKNLPPRLSKIDPALEPWQNKIRRVGQSNMTEHDPAVMNVEEWADYWHRCGADIVFVSVTGILAFYPSKVKFIGMASF